MTDFKKKQIALQLAWRNTQGFSPEHGFQNKKEYPYIISKREWTKTVWDPIRKDLLKYLKEQNIQHHSGTHNLLSSWILCANLYYICRQNVLIM